MLTFIFLAESIIALRKKWSSTLSTHFLYFLITCVPLASFSSGFPTHNEILKLVTEI